MKGLPGNLLASFLSKGWSAVLSLAFVPAYIRFLGVEAYGFIGAFLTLQAVIALLDLGFGAALTRELARSAAAPRTEAGLGDLLRTLEIVYWGMAVLIAAAVWLIAPFIADGWLKAKGLSVTQITEAIRMAAISLALQWPTNLYSGGLTGLQKQLRLARITAACGTLRVALTVLGLWLIAPTLQVFFLAQAAGNLLQTAMTGRAAWQELKERSVEEASFKLQVMRGILGFATGMTGIGLTSVFLTQMDKVVLSKTLSLESFGYYAIASTLASGMYIFISPMFAVLFPRFAELAAKNDKAGMHRLYHLSCQMMAVIILPVTATLAVFAPEILLLWTGNAAISLNSHLVLSFLIIGNALNGLMNMPYAMQLAHGWTRLAFYTNVVAICVCAPAVYLLSLKLGALGGALVWMLLMIGSALSSLFLTHRRFGLGAVRRWYFFDVGCPAVAAFLVIGIAKATLPTLTRGIGEAVLFVALAGAAGVAALLATPLVRNTVWRGILRPSSVI